MRPSKDSPFSNGPRIKKNVFYRKGGRITDIETILEKYKSGAISLREAEESVRSMGFLAVGDIAKVDTFRCRRTGVPEAILAEGKDDDDLIRIIRAHAEVGSRSLITRVSPSQAAKIKAAFLPSQVEAGRYGSTMVVHDGTNTADKIKKTGGVVAVISAGTADIRAAEEACITAREMGCRTIEIYDVGVAGYHRLILEMNKLDKSAPDAVVVAAGREGTLPTVVAGIIDAPVIGLPVSTGYGAGANGKAALYAMLQSCSVITVVNIDAGFTAGAYAARIANRAAALRNNEAGFPHPGRGDTE